jgi:hypothetical protein
MRVARGELLRWGMVAAYSGLIFYLSSQAYLHSGLEFLEFEDADKLQHAVAFAIWSALFSGALRSSRPGMSARRAVLWSSLAGSLYGASDEIHQLFVPGRVADVRDWAFDTSGALVGALLYQYLWLARVWPWWAHRRGSPLR